MKLKKIIAMVLATMLAISTINISTFALENDTVANSSFETTIVKEVKELTGLSFNDYEIVTLDNVLATDKVMIKETAIKIAHDDGVTIIIPKISDEETIVNSFDYAKSVILRDGSHVTAPHLVGMTVNISAYYNAVFSWGLWSNIYTPKSVYFSWSSSNSTARIDDIAVKFDANGDYWKINPLTDIGYEKYVSFDVYKINPTKGVSYGDWAAAMNDNYGLVCTDYWNHGGNIWYGMNYTVNGVTRYESCSWQPFGK